MKCLLLRRGGVSRPTGLDGCTGRPRGLSYGVNNKSNIYRITYLIKMCGSKISISHGAVLADISVGITCFIIVPAGVLVWPCGLF